MASPLHVHEFGPSDGIPLLALHGIKGHGARWRSLASTRLPQFRVLAPDLRGHGRSTPLPPWTLEQHAADVLNVIDQHQLDAVPVVAHSFGGAVALHLARLAPGRVSSLILLDPAVGIDPKLALERSALPHPTYPDRRHAWDAQRYDWPLANEETITAEINEHLEQVEGGWRFRYYPPAVITAWSEMARVPMLPSHGTPTLVVRALREPYVSQAFLNGCKLSLGSDFELANIDCGHMVYIERPGEAADLITRFTQRH
jgi:lipase